MNAPVGGVIVVLAAFVVHVWAIVAYFRSCDRLAKSLAEISSGAVHDSGETVAKMRFAAVKAVVRSTERRGRRAAPKSGKITTIDQLHEYRGRHVSGFTENGLQPESGSVNPGPPRRSI